MAKADTETPVAEQLDTAEETPVPTRKRVGDYNPDVESGETLDPIANQDVTITGVAFYSRKGRNGPYILSVITLDTDKLYHTGSPVVAERLAALYDLSMDELSQLVAADRQPPAPSNVFPLAAKFHREKSQNDASRSYWTVD